MARLFQRWVYLIFPFSFQFPLLSSNPYYQCLNVFLVELDLINFIAIDQKKIKVFLQPVISVDPKVDLPKYC